MALTDYQFSYNGLTFGAGTDIDVLRVEGLRGFRSIRSGDVNIPRDDGEVAGNHFKTGQTFSFRLKTFGEPESVALADLEQSVSDAFQISRETQRNLNFKLPGFSERRVKCRPIRLQRVMVHDQERGKAVWELDLRANDPRQYGATLKSVVVPLFDASQQGGIDYNLVDYAKNFPADFSGTGVVNNAGNAAAYPIVRFAGPVSGTITGVQLTNETNGDVLDIDTTITTSQLLTADMDSFITAGGSLIIDLDGSTRYNDWQLPRSPFSLSPGDNVLKFEITGTSTDGVCSVVWYDTWN